MEIVPYEPRFMSGCLTLFKGNQGKYFAEAEYEEFKEFLETNNSPYYVVWDGEDVVACGGWYYKPDVSAYLTWGMVSRQLHGQGVGTLLVKHRLAAIKQAAGATQTPIQIDTSQHTQGFYGKFGFVVTEVEPNGFGEGIDRVTMVCI